MTVIRVFNYSNEKRNTSIISLAKFVPMFRLLPRQDGRSDVTCFFKSTEMFDEKRIFINQRTIKMIFWAFFYKKNWKSAEKTRKKLKNHRDFFFCNAFFILQTLTENNGGSVRHSHLNSSFLALPVAKSVFFLCNFSEKTRLERLKTPMNRFVIIYVIICCNPGIQLHSGNINNRFLYVYGEREMEKSRRNCLTPSFLFAEWPLGNHIVKSPVFSDSFSGGDF